MITVDGFFEGPNREIDWHNVDNEFNDIAIAFLNSIDLLIFGRITYELMAGYWPTPSAITDDPVVAEKMNSLPKIVISKTLKTADWNNTELLNEYNKEEIFKLKNQTGKNIAIFGSSDLALNFLQDNLIDELRVFINPVLISKGKTLLNGLSTRLNLKLLKTQTFKSGNVLLIYEPKIN